MHSFDLIREPWIPTIHPDGTRTYLGLAETLTRAHEISAVYDPAPVVTLALHRVLIALLGRIYPVENRTAWHELAQRSHLDPALIEEYFDTWQNRFDLFDPERPFLQTPGLAPLLPQRRRTIAALIHSRSVGNNALLMDHSTDDAPEPIPPDCAARWLLASLCYGTGGLHPSDGPGGKASGQPTPLLLGSALLLNGATLLDTLRLNHVPRNVLPEALREPHQDRPAWEADFSTEASTRNPRGVLDLLTWRSRRILLEPSSSPRGVEVKHTLLFPGDRFNVETPLEQIEPMLAFRKAGKTTRRSLYPVSLRQHRPEWLELPLFLGEAEQPPSSITFFCEEEDRDMLQGLSLFGVESDTQRAKIYQWRRTDLPLTRKLLEPARRKLLSEALDLKSRTLSPRENLAFWSALEVPFRDFLQELSDEDPAAALQHWKESVHLASR